MYAMLASEGVSGTDNERMEECWNENEVELKLKTKIKKAYQLKILKA